MGNLSAVRRGVLGLLAPALAAVVAAQSGGLGLSAAVDAAWLHYPAIAAAQQAAARAQADVGVASTALWPVAGVAGQWDRGTDNATLGLAFPSPLPSISGTVPAKDYSANGAWTSALGLYFSWEVADFGRRAANIRYYRELALQSRDQLALTKLQVGAHAADAYLTVIAAQEQLEVAQSDLERWQQIGAIVHALVDQQLRPGADASRADAETAGAQIRRSTAQRNLATSEATLAEALDVRGALPPLSARSWLTGQLPSAGAPAPVDLSQHPQARAQQDAVAAAASRQAELARSALPRWYALATAYGRGSGVLGAGDLAPGATGLAPTTAGNWAVGVGLDFSISRWQTTRQQQAAAAAQLGQEQARQRQVADQLEAGRRRAAADLDAARAIAIESPVELAAARAGEAQARVRYQSGLAGVVDLANAEQLLAQGESDAALSQLQVWRALLESAFAAGDLNPFLQAAGGH